METIKGSSISSSSTGSSSSSSSPIPAVLSPSPIPEKTVRFSDFVSFSPSSAPIDLLLTFEEKEDLWYTMENLLSFRNEARETCRQMRLLDTVDVVNPMKSPMLARDSLTRGLEHRTCSERQRRKYLTTQLVVKAAHKLRNEPETLAALAGKVTAWAKALAVEEAARDHVRAVRVRATSDTSDTGFSRKRPPTSASKPDSQRRVKSRTSLIQPF